MKNVQLQMPSARRDSETPKERKREEKNDCGEPVDDDDDDDDYVDEERRMRRDLNTEKGIILLVLTYKYTCRRTVKMT